MHASRREEYARQNGQLFMEIVAGIVGNIVGTLARYKARVDIARPFWRAMSAGLLENIAALLRVMLR
jgi:uncharacterized membrane protein